MKEISILVKIREILQLFFDVVQNIERTIASFSVVSDPHAAVHNKVKGRPSVALGGGGGVRSGVNLHPISVHASDCKADIQVAPWPAIAASAPAVALGHPLVLAVSKRPCDPAGGDILQRIDFHLPQWQISAILFKVVQPFLPKENEVSGVQACRAAEAVLERSREGKQKKGKNCFDGSRQIFFSVLSFSEDWAHSSSDLTFGAKTVTLP